MKGISFYEHVIRRLVDDGILDPGLATVVVGGGETDRKILTEAGFTNLTITNIDIEQTTRSNAVEWCWQDAEHLTYSDKQFDQVITHEVLHHCASPHRALTEMYRVASHVLVAIEPRDTLLQRIAVSAGISASHEIEAVVDNGFTAGGLRGGPIPNFVYRWTQREVEKTLSTFDPTGPIGFRYFSSFRTPHCRLDQQKVHWKKNAGRFLGFAAEALTMLIPSQGNQFAFAAIRPAELFPWIKGQGINREWADARYAISPGWRRELNIAAIRP